MMFKAVFLYAVLRGIGDYLAGRPNPRGRIVALRIRQVAREVRKITRGFYGIANTSHKTARAFDLMRTIMDKLDAKEVRIND